MRRVADEHLMAMYRSADPDAYADEGEGLEAFLGNIDKIIGGLVMILMMYMVWSFFESPLGGKFGAAMGEFAETAVDILANWEWFFGLGLVFAAMPYIGRYFLEPIGRNLPNATAWFSRRCTAIWNWRNVRMEDMQELLKAKKYLDGDLEREVIEARPRTDHLTPDEMRRLEGDYLNEYRFDASSNLSPDATVRDLNATSLERKQAFRSFMAEKGVTGVTDDYATRIDLQLTVSRELETFQECNINGLLNRDPGSMSQSELLRANRMRDYIRNLSMRDTRLETATETRRLNELLQFGTTRNYAQKLRSLVWSSSIDTAISRAHASGGIEIDIISGQYRLSSGSGAAVPGRGAPSPPSSRFMRNVTRVTRGAARAL